MGVLLGAFLIALFHALLPTHWMSFVFVGRTQGWKQGKILSVALLAGSSHVLVTILLGLVVVWLGQGLTHVIGHWVQYLAATILIVFGVFFLVSHWQHREHVEKVFKDRWATLSLIGFLTFSPCETLLPVYFAVSPLGWKWVILLSVLIGVATLGTMLLMTFLLCKGLQIVRFQILEHYESLITGILVIVLGLVVLFFH